MPRIRVGIACALVVGIKTETRTAVVTFAAALAHQGFCWGGENHGTAQGIEMIRDALGIMEAIRADGSPEAIVDMIQDCADIATIKALATDAIYLLDSEAPTDPGAVRMRARSSRHARARNRATPHRTSSVFRIERTWDPHTTATEQGIAAAVSLL